MDDLLFRKNFNLGITNKGYFWKKVVKIRKTAQFGCEML